MHICSQLGSNLGPKVDPNWYKIDAKMHPILESIFGLLLGPILAPKLDPVNLKNDDCSFAFGCYFSESALLS